ncbi:DUF6086 family protein [Dactylosporangium sp. NPDC000521]|uniref:DUF6086 family protein n=1 Tax=Dactylosporangium sp. NPDC000521 TaxID=3363975 RepID=UPI0036CF9178
MQVADVTVRVLVGASMPPGAVGAVASPQAENQCRDLCRDWDLGGVSQYFQVGDLVLWNPAHAVAKLFARMTEAMVPVAGCPSGVGPDVGRDEYEVDPDAFAAFVDALTARYLATNHPVLTTMLEGYLPAALVMVQRSGRDVPALELPVVRDNRDISLNRDAFDPDGDRLRLLRLAEQHAQAMPR